MSQDGESGNNSSHTNDRGQFNKPEGIKINPRKKVMDPQSIKAKEIPRSKDTKAADEIGVVGGKGIGVGGD